MPSENKYKKTRDGYLLEIQEAMEKVNHYPPAFLKKMNIAQLYETAELIKTYGVEKTLKAMGYLLDENN